MIDRKYILTLLLIFATSFCINIIFTSFSYISLSVLLILPAIYHIYKFERKTFEKEIAIKNQISKLEVQNEAREITFSEYQNIKDQKNDEYKSKLSVHFNWALFLIIFGFITFFILNLFFNKPIETKLEESFDNHDTLIINNQKFLNSSLISDINESIISRNDSIIYLNKVNLKLKTKVDSLLILMKPSE